MARTFLSGTAGLVRLISLWAGRLKSSVGIIWLCGVCGGGPALAQDWQAVVGDAAVIAVLSDQEVVFDAYTRQRFDRWGETIYLTERAAVGRWRATDGRYCANWPPSEQWSCFRLEIAGPLLRFLGEDGTISQGTLVQ